MNMLILIFSTLGIYNPEGFKKITLLYAKKLEWYYYYYFF